MTTTVAVEHLNPEGLHQNPAFTNVVTIPANAKTVYVGGQNALTPEGVIVGKGELGPDRAGLQQPRDGLGGCRRAIAGCHQVERLCRTRAADLLRV
jgi:hypothetical protein